MNVNDILNSLNKISETLFKSVEKEVYTTLDKIMDIGPNILKIEPLKSLLFENKINGIIIIANSLMLFYITYYICSQLISLYNGNKAENVYLFIIKITIILLIINNSYFIIELILEITQNITDSVNMYCKEVCNLDLSFNSLKDKILSIKDFIKNDFISLDGLIKGVISFGIITILINFSIRYVTIIFLIIIFPFTLTTLSSNLTIGIFKSYFKILVTSLLTQIIIKFILLIPLIYKDVNSIMFKVILVGSIYIIYKMNVFIKDLTVKISEEGRNINIFNR